jgi:hypothetical protein
MEWATEDFNFTKNEVQQRLRTIVPDIQKGPLQGLFQRPRQVCHCDFVATLRISFGAIPFTDMKPKGFTGVLKFFM